MTMQTQNAAEEEAILAIRAGVNNRYDEILIQIHPLAHRPEIISVRVRRGPAKIFEVSAG